MHAARKTIREAEREKRRRINKARITQKGIKIAIMWKIVYILTYKYTYIYIFEQILETN